MIKFKDTVTRDEFGLVEMVESIFSPTGLLSRARNFEYRPQQQAMAVAVARALEAGEHLAVEAGTGVGKSLGYLIPAILYAIHYKKRALVSTHTINLQEQLSDKDLPLLHQVLDHLLPRPFTYSLLKGRANYLCTRRLHNAMRQAESLFTSPEIQELRRIHEWAQNTTDGSLSDFEIEPDPKVWAQVCSERGLCSPKLCGPDSEFARQSPPCFYQLARQRMFSSDVLVLNHTLLFTLLDSMEENSGGGILFKDDFLVVDEAHMLEHVASKNIGISLSMAQIQFALNRLWNPHTEKGLLATLRRGREVALVAQLLDETRAFFDALEKVCDELAAKNSDEPATVRRPQKGGSREKRAWTELRIRRPDVVPDNLTLPIQRLREALADLIKSLDDEDAKQELAECNRRLSEVREQVAQFLSQKAEDYVYWVERAGKTQRLLTLNAAPIDVADYLRRRFFNSETSVIMTSATLAVTGAAQDERATGEKEAGGNPNHVEEESAAGMEYFVRRVGAEKARRLRVGSPFDYQRQMKLYIVRQMADPRDPGYRDSLIKWIEHFIKLTHGKAFVLFTNTRLMQEVGEAMAPFFAKLRINCFVQGTGTPRSRMLELFKEDVDSVLFGTASFWQGVDVPGESLSNVIITRLPFAVPDHPLIEARLETIEARGGDSFTEFSLPEAVLKFRQGIGRLIRTRTDRGIVVVLDNRILMKRYGRAFLEAMPKCPVEVL